MVDLASRFRPGMQQRGEDTRRRILETALELFATDGFEGASTRTLAERAGVNLPAIQYYFGSKEGLYRAVIEQIIQEMEVGVAAHAAHVRTRLADPQLTRAEQVELLCGMLDNVIALMLDETVPNRESRQRFFARMEAEPTSAFDALQDAMIRNVCAPCSGIIARLIDRPPEDEQVLLRAMTIIGQAKIFCGWGPSRLLGWDTIGEARVHAVQDVIRSHVKAIFCPVGSV